MGLTINWGNHHQVHCRWRRHWRAAPRATVAVADSGLGIADEDQQRLFERFFRARDTRQFGGLGLGLYLCEDIVKRHSGVIEVHSVVGQGSTFTVDLPLFADSGASPESVPIHS